MSVPAPPADPADALDSFEAQACDLLRTADMSGLEELRLAIDAASRMAGVPYTEPPPIDPSEPRRSSAELEALLDAVAGVASGALPPGELSLRSRAGYALQPDASGIARVVPAFAQHLGASNLRELFPDLWAIDLDLWQKLEHAADRRALALAWLESPGRRLVQDIGLLRRLHEPAHSTRLGATDLTLARIYAAAGVAGIPDESSELQVFWDSIEAFLDARPPRWRELHAATPGRSLEAWEPWDGEPARALELLEHGSPPGLRGAALAWLLNEAVHEPFFEIDGVRRDLRDELPIRLATALSNWFGDERGTAIGRELEALTLQHAALITAADTRPGATFRAWGVARWLGRCLRRSPWFGEDEEILVAHLRALLPREQASAPANADALHPARFGVDALDPAEIAFLSGVLNHYAYREESAMLLPTPLPIVHALRRIAERSMREAEEQAERVLAEGRNELDWPAPNLAPPLAARWLMTRRSIGWIQHVREEAQRDTIERFARDPARYAWVSEALRREGEALTPELFARAIEVLRAAASGATPTPLPESRLAIMVAGLMRGLDDAEVQHAVDLPMFDDPEWRPFVLDALAATAERLERATIFTHVLDRLLELVEREGETEKNRLNAALFALRRASDTRLPGGDAILARLVRAAANPPMSNHLSLRRALRRVAGPLANAGGSGR